MTGDGRRAMSLAALVAVVVLTGARPADAAWTKVYTFTNQVQPATNETSVSAKLIGIESVTTDYAIPPGWSGSKRTYSCQNGVWYTTLLFPASGNGSPVNQGGSVTVGWTTSDNSCRCCDLRWGDASHNPVVSPTLIGGVPGSGVALFDGNKLTVVIPNDDPAKTINLSNVQYVVTGARDPKGLASLLESPLEWANLGPRSVHALPAPTAPPAVGPNTYVDTPAYAKWSTEFTTLSPGRSTAFVVDKEVGPGQAFIMRGSVGAGDAKVDWIEQVTP